MTSEEAEELNLQLCATFGIDPTDVVSLDLRLAAGHPPSLIVTRHSNPDGRTIRTTDRYRITEKVTP